MKKLLTTLVCALLLLSFAASACAAGMLQKGDRGPSVKALQEALVNGGWADLVCDGVYGPKTEAAVKYYQKQVSSILRHESRYLCSDQDDSRFPTVSCRNAAIS